MRFLCAISDRTLYFITPSILWYEWDNGVNSILFHWHRFKFGIEWGNPKPKTKADKMLDFMRKNGEIK